MSLCATILGCGSSGGVPRLGGIWGACDPIEPRNRRRRCSLLVTREGPGGRTAVLIDTSPDMRAQLLDAEIGHLDAVIYTHEHADHMHGLDDLRMVVFNRGSRLPVYADAPTQSALLNRFAYAFVQPEGSSYPPILDLHPLAPVTVIEGAGGPIAFEQIPVEHGRIRANGFRIRGEAGDLAYIPDVSEIAPEALRQLEGLSIFIIDALRYKPHPSHAHLEQSLAWIEALAPERAVLTNLHIDLDYHTLEAQTEAHITPAYDGMVLSF